MGKKELIGKTTSFVWQSLCMTSLQCQLNLCPQNSKKQTWVKKKFTINTFEVSDETAAATSREILLGNVAGGYLDIPDLQ